MTMMTRQGTGMQEGTMPYHCLLAVANMSGGGDDPNEGGNKKKEDEDSNESSLDPNTFDDGILEDPEWGWASSTRPRPQTGRRW
jgi:hypothetical protein